MAAPRAVALDFDGVLVDSLERVLAVAGDAAEAVGARRPGVEEFRTARSLAFAPIVAMLGMPEEQAAAFGIELGRRMRGEAAARAHPLYPGAADAVRALASGAPLAILTDNVAEVVERTLGPAGLLPLFDEILDGTGRLAKSDRLLGWLSRRGIAAREAAFVGDTVGDLDEGRRAGVLTVAAAWGYQPEEFLRSAGPDLVARSPRDLPGALGFPSGPREVTI